MRKIRHPTIYKSSEGEAIFHSIYDKQLASLRTDYISTTVNTRFGSTHIIITGPEHGPPLLVFHGGNSSNPHSLKNILPLANDYRIYAPDTIGHPGRSAQTCLSASDSSYGQWAVDIMDNLGLEEASLIGISFGGGILVRMAVHAPHRISKAVFIVPAGIANPSTFRILIQLGIPMLIYRLFPSEKRLRRAIQKLFPSPDEDTLQMIKAVFDHVKMKAQMPKSASKSELAEFTAPTMILAAENDLLFPAKKVLTQAGNTFPNMVSAVELKGASHAFYESDGDLKNVLDHIRKFLRTHLE